MQSPALHIGAPSRHAKGKFPAFSNLHSKLFKNKILTGGPTLQSIENKELAPNTRRGGGRVIRRISCLWGIDSGIPLRRNLLQQPLPRLLILPKSLLHILQNPLKVRIRFQIVPSRILLEPWIILIP